MRASAAFALASVLLMPGCLFDGAVPDGAQILCDANDDCPALTACRAGVCIDAALLGDEAASVRDVVTEPARAAPGDVVRVSFVTTPLALTPIVRLELAGTPSTLLEEAADAPAPPPEDGQAWSFIGTVAGDAGFANAEVAAALVAALVSEEGVAGDAALGAVVIDRAAPDAIVTLTPSAAPAGLGVDVGIAIDANEEIESAALQWDGPALDVVESARGLDFIAFKHTVDEDSPDGSFTVASVEIVDAVGNVGVVAVDTSVAIDTAAPLLSSFAFDQPVYGGATRRTVTLTFQSDDLLAALPDGALGPVDMACTTSSSSATQHVCIASLDDVELDEGATSVVAVVTARDFAGNLAVEARAADVDTVPPSLVTSFAKAFTPPGSAGGVFTRTLTLQGRVEVGFTTNEVLPIAPVVTGRNAAGDVIVTLQLDADASVGNTFFYRRVIDAPLPAGDITMFVRLEDRGANVVEIELPDSAFTVSDVALPPCLAVDASGATVCTDFDGDGFFGSSATCAAGNDCDDTRALVHPDGIEIAGNGVDDDCDGASSPLSDAIAAETIFVAPDGANACDTSSPSAPCGDLDEAIAASGDEGRPIYLTEGFYGTAGSLGLRSHLIGGFAPGFAPGTGRSEIFALGNTAREMFLVDSNAPTRIEAVRLVGPMCAGIFSTFSGARLDIGRVDVVDFAHPAACEDFETAQGISMDRPGTIAGVVVESASTSDVNVHGVVLASGVRLVDARIDLESTRDVDAVLATFDGTSFVARVDVLARAGGRAAGMRAHNNVVVLASAFDVVASDAAGVINAFAPTSPPSATFVHATVRTREATGGAVCARLGGDVDVRGFVCAIADEPVGFAAAFNVDSTTTADYEAVFVDGTTCVQQLALDGSCSSPAGTSLIDDVGFADATGASLAFTSPLVDGVAASLLDPATSAAVIDLQGTCRGGANVDPGADEL